MIKWLKSLFGFEAPLEPTLQADKETAEASKPKPKKATKKTVKKKPSQKKVQDEALQAMNKKELLDIAKIHGIKANASLKKAELIERIKNG